MPHSLTTVFLDRDGVINEKMPEGQYVSSTSEFRVLPGVREAIKRLNLAGIRIIVVSNQRGVALGKTSLAAIDEIHRYLQTQLEQDGAHIDGLFFCPHHKGVCSCRKPLPGLYEQAVARFPEIKPQTSVMVGDSLSDIQFGNRLDMRTVYIHNPESSTAVRSEDALRLANLVCRSFFDAVGLLLDTSN